MINICSVKLEGLAIQWPKFKWPLFTKTKYIYKPKKNKERKREELSVQINIENLE